MPLQWPEVDAARAFEIGKQAWPTLSLTLESFAEFLSERFGGLAEVRKDLIEDLFLACACSRDEPGALRRFRERFLPVVNQTVRRFDESSAFTEEVFQRLSADLFVGPASGQGKITRYSGQGVLAGFIGTAAKRIALRMAASSARFQGEAELVHEFAQFNDQETMLLKVHYRETFNEALSIAVRQLPRRDRLILRMNLIERVSTTRIAAMYKVSQPTVSRWIQRSAREIFLTVKDLICDQLELDTRELESLLFLVRSQIEITISHADGNSAPPTP